VPAKKPSSPLDLSNRQASPSLIGYLVHRTLAAVSNTCHRAQTFARRTRTNVSDGHSSGLTTALATRTIGYLASRLIQGHRHQAGDSPGGARSTGRASIASATA